MKGGKKEKKAALFWPKWGGGRKDVCAGEGRKKRNVHRGGGRKGGN